MYLNRAEATVKGGLTGYDAVADVAAVANNRGALPSPATEGGIMTERKKEFAWEAHLWFDLGRTKAKMTRNDVADGVIKEVEWGTKVWAMPIPEREHNANENLTPNPGY
jgi:hypothetical protein